jgi:hypothetical protein
VVLYLSGILATAAASGISDAVWICFGLCVTGLMVALFVFAAGGARLQQPDLYRWQEEGDPAWDSPPLFAAIRVSKGTRREAARQMQDTTT